jgi:hypothetical protein
MLIYSSRYVDIAVVGDMKFSYHMFTMGRAGLSDLDHHG